MEAYQAETDSMETYQAKTTADAIYVLPHDEWQKNYEVDTSEDVKSLSFGKKAGGGYIPVNVAITFARKLRAYPEVVYIQDLPEGRGTILHVRLVWFGRGVSPTMLYPVMAHGAGRHQAKSEPDARDITDSLGRAYAKCIALETGYGWGLFLGEDPNATSEPTPSKSKSSKKRRYEEEEEPEEEEEEEFDFEEEEETEEEEEEDEPSPKKRRRGSTSARFNRRRRG